MLRIYLMLSLAVMLTSQNLALQNQCKGFWKKWNERACSSKGGGKCFVNKMRSFMVTNDGTGDLRCDYKPPERDLFQCIIDIPKLEMLKMQSCSFTSFIMKDLLLHQKPSTLRLEYFHERKVPLNIKISGINSLKSLGIVGSRTDSLFEVSLSSLPMLTELYVQNYNFTTFSRKPFRHVKGIKQLTIRNGELEVLPEDIFSDLNRLTNLVLSWNRIVEIKPKTFDNLRFLRLLDLSGNQIEDLGAEVLSGLSQLQEIQLGSNKFKKMPDYDWFKFPLRLFNMSDNDISTVTLPVYTKTNTEILLDSNDITTIILDHTERSNNSPSYSIIDNYLICDCQLEDFLIFLHSELQESHWVFSFASTRLKCRKPDSHKTLQDVCSVLECDLCSAEASQTYIEPGMILLSSTIFFICLVFCTTLAYIYFNRAAVLPMLYSWNMYCACCDRHLSKEDKTYDVFMCYHSEDEKRAEEIQNTLGDNKFALCLVNKEGSSKFGDKESLRDVLMNSRAAVLLLSSTMVMTNWFKDEYLEVHNRMPLRYFRNVIPIFIDEFRRLTITPKDLVKLLYLKRYLNWEEKYFWQRLRFYLRKPK